SSVLDRQTEFSHNFSDVHSNIRSNPGPCALALCRTRPPKPASAILGSLRNHRKGTGHVESNRSRLLCFEDAEISCAQWLAAGGNERTPIWHEHHGCLYIRVSGHFGGLYDSGEYIRLPKAAPNGRNP